MEKRGGRGGRDGVRNALHPLSHQGLQIGSGSNPEQQHGKGNPILLADQIKERVEEAGKMILEALIRVEAKP